MNDNLLYCGDNLDVLRRYIGDESVDLVYLDPPWNSKTTYSVLFTQGNGTQAPPIKAFQDTWRWDEAAAAAYEAVVEAGGRVSQAMQAFRCLLGTNDMLAYLSMMAPRLVELRRVLKSTGSIYLHCDPTAGHYLKILMDAVFGPGMFRNEIVWLRDPPGKGAKRISSQWPRNFDVLLFYSKSEQFTFVQPYAELTPEQRKAYRYKDARGCYKAVQRGDYSDASMAKFRREGRVHVSSSGREYVKYYLHERQATIGSVWTDIPGFGTRTASKERQGYPTQKPEALLQRIMQASSREGECVLDPFCGSGTTLVVAERLRRRWIGIDKAYLAIKLARQRFQQAFGHLPASQVIGEHKALESA